MPETKLFQTRALEITDVRTRADGADGEPEFVELEFPFASETPVERFFGFEQLEVSKKAARLDRVAQGVAPLLADHHQLIGRVLSITIGSDRIARARVRFSRSAGAADVVRDVLDGIRQAVSFGYRVHRMELIETGDDGDRFRVTDWELFEITIASMPADPTVGVHRSSAAGEHFAPLIEQARRERAAGARIMPEKIAPTADKIRELERARIASLEQVGKNFRATPEQVRTAIDQGHTIEMLLQVLREDRSRQSQPLEPPPCGIDFERSLARERAGGARDDRYGLDSHDLTGYSLFRAISAQAAGRPDEAGLEFAVSDHIRGIDGRRDYNPRALSVPHSALFGLASRAIGKVTPSATGAGLVGIEHLAGSFIDLLTPRVAVMSMGATVINANGPDLSIPRQTSAAGVGWVDEGAGSGESSPGFDAISLSPKTARARADMTRRMLLQAEPAVEGLVASEIVRAIAQAIDSAALSGSGGVAPTGIMQMSGVGSVAYDPTSGQTERQTFLALQDAVASTDAPMGAPGVIMSSSMRSRLMGLSVDPGSGVFVATETNDPDAVRIAGIRAVVSNNVPRNLGVGTNEHAIFFADWSELIVALWSSVDVMPDQVTLGDSGGLVLRAFQDIDIAAKHETSFAVTQVNPLA
jgi:HK97 family phage major capsid protein